MKKKEMKQYQIDYYGKKSPLHLRMEQIPELEAFQVLVTIKAIGLNPLDNYVRLGASKALLSYKMPLVLGNDFSGEIVKIGKKVTDFQVGDAVFGCRKQSKMGALADYIVVDCDEIELKPKNLSYEEAASIPLAGLTSWQALNDLLKVKAGDKLLVTGGSGGVGTLGIQIGKYLGATVVTTASSRGAELVKSLGADQIIDYENETLAGNKESFDKIFDTVGGKTTIEALKASKVQRQIVTIRGLPTLRYGKEYHYPLYKKIVFGLISSPAVLRAKLKQINYQFLFFKVQKNDLSQLRYLLETEQLIPVIDRIYSFSEMEEALSYLAKGHVKGKIVVSNR
ncbi:NADP-dependent oxidoreductase [Enterococcus sp. LJL99]